ncbi:hypothetical protein [Alistipes sp.]|uniref:hypothetical protein n=1 Tax=Alistipes sp. TaxID=1872444 RepID=UPI003AF0594A
MDATYSPAKIMRNAWYLKRIRPATTFAACLRKAWRNERLAVIHARIDRRRATDGGSCYRPELLTVPADYYGAANRYYGD